MAGVGGCGSWRWLCAGRSGTSVHGRIHRVHQDSHDHLSDRNHAVGGCDERAAVAQGETEDRATFKNAVRRRISEKTSTLYSTYRNDKSAYGGVTMTAATSSSPASGRSIDVNGVALYYEEQGEGDPLIHGGLGSSAR